MAGFPNADNFCIPDFGNASGDVNAVWCRHQARFALLLLSSWKPREVHAFKKREKRRLVRDQPTPQSTRFGRLSIRLLQVIGTASPSVRMAATESKKA
jgi:hypothetical protein